MLLPNNNNAMSTTNMAQLWCVLPSFSQERILTQMRQVTKKNSLSAERGGGVDTCAVHVLCTPFIRHFPQPHTL